MPEDTDEDFKALLRTLGLNQLQIIKGQEALQKQNDALLARLDDVFGAVKELIGHTTDLAGEVREVTEAAKPPEDGENPFDRLEAAIGTVGENVLAIPEQFVGAVQQVLPKQA